MGYDIAIDISDLSYSYPDSLKALDTISLRISPGENVAIIGPNGAGKSTLLLHFNGILSGTGSVRINGTPVTKKSVRQVRKTVGYVFQNPEDQLFLPTLFDDISFGPVQYGLSEEEIRQRVTEILTRFDLTGIANRSSFNLSFGEQKLASLATALVMEPEILVLDEPSSNLDSKHRRELLNILKNSSQTIVIATHDLDFAAELCERSIVLFKGKITADGESRDILTDKELLEENGLELPFGSYF
ncbi:energy-coupling factor ABC transporter ATP-binding protein [candidate division KSB1 bacterium]